MIKILQIIIKLYLLFNLCKIIKLNNDKSVIELKSFNNLFTLLFFYFFFYQLNTEKIHNQVKEVV